jgi:mono/diheme cytochrome c family protein
MTCKSLKYLLIPVLIFVSIQCNNEGSRQITEDNAKKGELLFNSSGCTKCHFVSGESGYGAPLDFKPDKKVNVFRNGKKKSIIPNRKYIIRSIKKPEFEKVEGYQDKKMPATTLTDEEIDLITDYILYINTNRN